MVEDKSFISQIIARRIPHIIGMYIAAVWLAVEIAEWMSSKFSVNNQLSSYVFIGMLAFIPSIIMLAWGHGRPGKDRWSKLEMAWIPLNIVLSLMTINYVVNPQKPEIQTLTLQKFAEPHSATGKKLAYTKTIEVEQNHHQNVLTFFWDNKTNKENLNWLSYGATWLFSQDLKRTPDISVLTPYSYNSMIRNLKEKGFKDSLNIPLSLALQIANKRSISWMVLGSFTEFENKLSFNAKLYKVNTGKLEREFTATNQHMFKALDKISDAIGKFLLTANQGDINIIPDLAIEDHISNNIEAVKLFIKAVNKVAYDNDYQTAIDYLLASLMLDPSFAMANVYASYYYRGLGDYPNAIKQTKLALKLDHKIYKESVYSIKARLFNMTGDTEKELQILENWVNVFPQSPDAHTRLAYKYLYTDNHLDDAEAEFIKLLKLDKDNPENLFNLGKIYRARENLPKTMEYLGKYLEVNPEDVDAYMQMGNAFNQFSLFKKAIKMYQQASLLGSEDLEAEINIARTQAKSGKHKVAIKYLDELLEQSDTYTKTYEVLQAKVDIYHQTGQIKKAFKVMNELEKPAKKVLTPFNYLFNVDSDRISLYTKTGDYDKAIKYTDKLIKNSKPPFSNMSSLFYLLIYFETREVEKFEAEFKKFEVFLDKYPIPVYDSLIPAWRGILASWQGDTQKAIDMLESSIASLKNSVLYIQTFEITDQLVYNKAIALSALNKDDEAFENLEAILIRNPLFARAHYLSAKIYFKLNQNIQAQEHIKKAQAIWQDADANFTYNNNLKKLIAAHNQR